MLGEAQRKQCKNLVMMWTKLSKEILGARDLILPCTDTFSILSASCVRRGRNSSRSHMGGVWSSPQPHLSSFAWQAKPSLPLGNNLLSPDRGCLGDTEPQNSLLRPLQGCRCRSRDASVHSATRALLSSHYFVIFIDLLGKNLCTSLFTVPRHFVMVQGVVIYLYLALSFGSSHAVARTSFSIWSEN